MSLLSLWAVRLAGGAIPAAALGLLLIARRTASTGSLAAGLGMPTALERYVAMNQGRVAQQRRYVLFSLAGIVLLAAVVLPTAALLREPLGGWLYPAAGADAGALAFGTACLLWATAANTIATSVFLSFRMVLLANLMRLVAAGALAAAVLYQGDAATAASLVRWESLGLALVSTVSMVTIIGKCRAIGGETLSTPWKADLREFVAFGLPRGAVSFLNGLALLVGPWLLRRQPEDVGYLLLALTWVRVLQLAIGPLTRMSSVITANLMGRQDSEAITLGTRLSFGAALYASALATAALVPWRHEILLLWLGNAELAAGAADAFLVVAWLMVPLTIYEATKGIVNVRWMRPLNVYPLALGLGVQVGLYSLLTLWMTPLLAAGISMLALFWILGLCSIYWLRDDLRPLAYWRAGPLLTVSLVTGILGWWAANVGGALPAAVWAVASLGALAALVRWARSGFLGDLLSFGLAR